MTQSQTAAILPIATKSNGLLTVSQWRFDTAQQVKKGRNFPKFTILLGMNNETKWVHKPIWNPSHDFCIHMRDFWKLVFLHLCSPVKGELAELLDKCIHHCARWNFFGWNTLLLFLLIMLSLNCLYYIITVLTLKQTGKLHVFRFVISLMFSFLNLYSYLCFFLGSVSLGDLCF